MPLSLAALVIVVPNEPQNPMPTPNANLLSTIFKNLLQHCLLTTRLHVIGPQYVQIEVKARLVRKQGSGLTPEEVEQTIREYLHPLRGGLEGKRWPFGRPVYYSEMYQQLEILPKVDHVEELKLGKPGEPHIEEEGIVIPLHALVYASEIKVMVTDEDARGGSSWQ